jgi:hypothetical protein
MDVAGTTGTYMCTISQKISNAMSIPWIFQGSGNLMGRNSPQEPKNLERKISPSNS